MSVIKALILGIIQGLTEFLPVSSSGHLVIFQTVLGTDNNSADLMFDSLLHLGTLIAVFIVFKETIFKLVIAFSDMIKLILTGKFRIKNATDEQKLILFLIVSIMPLFLILPVKDYIETAYTSITLTGTALIVTSLLLFISDKVVGNKATAKEMKLKHALAIGFTQAFAIFPGISRSGSTITSGIMCGLDREFAAQYSFILSIPTILAGVILNLSDIATTGNFNPSLIPEYIAGTAAAAISGLLSIKLLQKLLKTKKFIIFSIYCLAVGLFAIIYGIV